MLWMDTENRSVSLSPVLSHVSEVCIIIRSHKKRELLHPFDAEEDFELDGRSVVGYLFLWFPINILNPASAIHTWPVWAGGSLGAFLLLAASTFHLVKAWRSSTDETIMTEVTSYERIMSFLTLFAPFPAVTTATQMPRTRTRIPLPTYPPSPPARCPHANR